MEIWALRDSNTSADIRENPFLARFADAESDALILVLAGVIVRFLHELL
jgi:hypothetical protein